MWNKTSFSIEKNLSLNIKSYNMAKKEFSNEGNL